MIEKQIKIKTVTPFLTRAQISMQLLLFSYFFNLIYILLYKYNIFRAFLVLCDFLPKSNKMKLKIQSNKKLLVHVYNFVLFL